MTCLFYATPRYCIAVTGRFYGGSRSASVITIMAPFVVVVVAVVKAYSGATCPLSARIGWGFTTLGLPSFSLLAIDMARQPSQHVGFHRKKISKALGPKVVDPQWLAPGEWYNSIMSVSPPR